MKINRLNHTKSLFPHFYDKTDDSNFTKHLKVVGKSQYDIRHKLKTIEWSRILEKPLQIWKEQTESYVYDMHFKVIMPYLKEVNVYKNPILNANEEIIGFEKVDNPEDLDENGEQIGRAIHKTFEYENMVRLYEDVLSDLVSAQRVPNDTFLLEVYTWDDYHFLKGFPENDYTVKEDNILQYRYNETFLSINVEEISYSKYLTFRVHKDKIKRIRIYKNDEVLLNLFFDINLIGKSSSTDFSYTYFDDDFTNERTYLQSAFDSYFEIEDAEHNNVLVYLEEDNLDEYVLRILLSDSDFDDNGVIKDIYDLEVTSFEKRYRCRHEYDRVYTKRYCGYDEQLNDCFDHDYSLDMIGRLLNIHRFRFYQIYEMNDKYLSRTYPSYNNRATEDDYHYMKRIQFYISNYNHIVFPVLEFWKYYHTMATIKSRKRIVGEMDYAYFRTRDSVDYICSDEISLDEEEFDSETVIGYSINKATVLEGIANFINLDRGWYEATVVNDVYVVPSTDYHLKYVLEDNSDDVTIRLICYNRQGVELRTTPIELEDKDYLETTVNTTITIPEDTVSIKLVLESNASFSFKEATFERMTVANFDNYYMGTETDYNPNVYELYTVYEDLPSNLRIGGDRFDILFKRSLPITKKGFFFMDVEEEEGDALEISDNFSLHYDNILTTRLNGTIGNNGYENTASDHVLENCDYILSYYVESEPTNSTYSVKDEIYSPLLDGSEEITPINQYTPTITDNELVTGCGYLTEGWSNIKDWELTFEYYTTGDNNGYTVIPKGTDRRDYNGLQQWYNNQLNFYVEGEKPSGYITNATVKNEWVNVRITKVGYIWTVYYNGVKKTEWDLSSYSSVVDEWNTMCIGLDKNANQNTAKIKNIVVKEMDYTPLNYDDELVTTTITYYHIQDDNPPIDIGYDVMEQKIYADKKTHIAHEFTTPPNTQLIKINVDSDTDATLTDIRLSRETELSDEEMYNGN